VGVTVRSDGVMHRGEYEGGRPHGHEQSIDSDGTIFARRLRNGKASGFAVVQKPERRVFSGQYESSVQIGAWDIWYPSGAVWRTVYDNAGKGISMVQVSAPPPDRPLSPPKQDTSTPGSPDYLPARRQASAASSDDPKVPGASYRP